MKKIILAIIISAFMIINVNADIVNENKICISNSEYNNLINLGFSHDEIETMQYDIYTKNKDIQSELIGKQIKYYKTVYRMNSINIMSTSQSRMVQTTEISEEEFNKSDDKNEFIINGNEIVQTEYKKMELSLSYISSSKQYRTKNVLTWKKMPFNRSYVIIAMANNNAVSEPVANTYHADIFYKTYNTCLQTTSSSTKTSGFTYKKTPSGAGVSFILPSDSYINYSWNDLLGQSYPCVDIKYKNGATGTYSAPQKISAMRITLYYNLSKVSKAALNSYGSYRHSTSSISANPSFSITPGSAPSIGIAPTLNSKFDSMNDTQITISSPKW